MGQLILPTQTDVDVEQQRDLFSSLRPTYKQAAGDFAHSFKESSGIGPFLRQKELNDAGWRPWGSVDQKVDPKNLNDQFGIEGRLDFSKLGPMTRDQARVIYNAKLDEIEHQDRRERSTGMTSAFAFGQDLVAGMLDPIGMGLGFAVTPARFIPGLRGLTPLVEDAGTRFIPRASAAFAQTSVNAAAGMAMLEPYNLYMHQQMAADYTMADSLASIAFGGLAGGTLHVTGLGAYKLAQSSLKGLHWVGNQVPSWMGKIDPVTHEKAFDVRLKQIMNGEDTGVTPIVETDPKLMAESQVKDAINNQTEPPAPVVPDPEVLAQELKTAEGTAPDLSFKDRIVKVKAEFDHKIEQLVSAVSLRTKFNSKGLEVNGKSMDYDLQGVKLNGVQFNYVKQLSSDTLDFDAMTGGKITNSSKDPFGKFSEKTETINSKGQKVPLAYGTLIREKDGRIWVVKPKGNFGGYATTFSKGRLNPGEDAYAAAIRETFEETGMVVKGVGYLGEFERTTTNTHYMIAERIDGTPQAFGNETSGVELIDVATLTNQLTLEGNKNDLAVLQKAIEWANKHNQQTSGSVDLEHVVKLDPDTAAKLLGRSVNTYAKTMVADVPAVHVSELGEPLSGQLGSNKGGFYSTPEGDFYVKFPQSEDHVKSEAAATLLYKKAAEMAGMKNIPDPILVYGDNGKLVGIGSRWIDDVKSVGPDELAAMLKDPKTPQDVQTNIREIGGSWVFDAWIGNRDVYGTGPTWNIVHDADWNLYKIDFGGSLEYRAQGALKNDWGPNATELNSFPGFAGKNLIKEVGGMAEFGAEMVLRLSPDDIKSALVSAGYEGDKLTKMLSQLVQRQDDVRKLYPDVSHAVAKLYHNQVQHHDSGVAWSYLQSLGQKFKNLFTKEEIKAVNSYQDSSYGLNSALWSGLTLTPTIQKWVNNLDAAFAKAPALNESREVVVFRREHLSWHPSLNATNIVDTLQNAAFMFKGYMSASSTPTTSGSLHWKITLEPGVKGIPMTALDQYTQHGVSDAFGMVEMEILLPRNQLMFIDSVEMKVDKHGHKYWQANARLINPDKLHSTPKDILNTAKAMASKPKAETDVFGGDVDAYIKTVVDQLYEAQKPAEIPVLTDKVAKKTEVMTQVEKEIAELEGSIRKAISEDEAAVKAMETELESVNEGIKKSKTFGAALKEAWTCFKGM